MTNDPLQLISGYFDDQLSDEEFAALRAWLLEDPEHMRLFVRHSFLHSRVHDILQQHDVGGLAFSAEETELSWVDPSHIVSLLDEEAAAARKAREAAERARLEALAASEQRNLLLFDPASQRIEAPAYPRRLAYFGVAVAAALMVLVGQWVVRSFEPPEGALELVANVPRPIASISESLDAAWRDRGRSAAAGTPLLAGGYSLLRGVVKVEYDSGVELLIEGPAEFELLTPDRAKLNVGRVVANVPPQAIGFTLLSNAASFVDLGTEFGVEVQADGQASISVLDGEVALVRGKEIDAGRSQTLQVGAARLVSADGTEVSEIPFEESYFIRYVPATPAELAILQSRPLAYWPMNEPTSAGRIEDVGRLSAEGLVGSGVIQGAQADCAGSKRLTAFTDKHEGIELGLLAFAPEANFTCEAWVVAKDLLNTPPQRILSNFDRMPRDGFSFGIVDRGWYDLPERGPFLHVTAHGVYDCVSEQSIPTDEWVHLAAVYNEQGEPQLYINGEPVEKRFRVRNQPAADELNDEQKEDEPPEESQWENRVQWAPSMAGQRSDGPTRIGRNPLGADGKCPSERWQGMLAGLAIYDRAMSRDEIQKHYAAGKSPVAANGK